MNIYVGNLASEVTEKNLREAFDAFGQLTSVTLLTDKRSGESRGFGFVDMASDAEAQAAIEGLNGKDLQGKILNVAKTRPRVEKRDK